jgi:hypothetical protein
MSYYEHNHVKKKNYIRVKPINRKPSLIMYVGICPNCKTQHNLQNVNEMIKFTCGKCCLDFHIKYYNFVKY